MKRISFLAFFTLLFMAVEMVTAFIDMWGTYQSAYFGRKENGTDTRTGGNRKSDWDKVCAGTEYNAG